MEENTMSGKILCVESHSENMALLTCILEGIGYEVMPASNGAQAIEMLTKQAVDGVLLEYNLPDVAGTTVRAQIKAVKPDMPVLLFAGVGTQTPIMLRFFDAYLRKGDRRGEGLGDLDL
jgi:CheY-like chemotaxis protein